MRSAIYFLCMLAVGGCSQARNSGEHPSGQLTHSHLAEDSPNSDGQVRNLSKPDLARQIVAMIETNENEQIESALRQLTDNRFLARFGLQNAFAEYADQKLLEGIFTEISKLPSKKADAAYLRLAAAPVYKKYARLMGVLMKCSAKICEPSEKWLDYLESHTGPGPLKHTSFVISILSEMRSPAACRRIENLLFSASHESERAKIAWFRWDLLTVRDDPATIGLYKNVLTRDISSSKLRNAIVETIFDFRPHKWYPTGVLGKWPKPPNRREASTTVLEDLMAIADSTNKLDLTEETRASVEKGRKEIEEILAFRRSKGPERIAKYIAQLDADQYPVRQKATKELIKFGDWSEPALRKAKESPISPEVRKRVDSILKQIEKSKHKSQ